MKQSGFTLVELVSVMVLLGIVAVFSTQFIKSGVSIYSDAARRDSLSQQSRFAIERMTRELRNALPGSVRVRASAGGVTQCVEFIPVEVASTYLSLATTAINGRFDAVDFDVPVGLGWRVAIYPIDAQAVYGAGSNTLANVGFFPAGFGGVRTVPLTALHTFPLESPKRRFYIIPPGPVSFCVVAGSLTRHSGYIAGAVQAVPPAGGVLLAEHIQRLDQGGNSITIFSHTPGSLQRASIVHMDLQFSDPAQSDEWLRFVHQVSLSNTP